jgi:Na+-transporting NADH:ubiquinone oxidoreductase subunit NqrC
MEQKSNTLIVSLLVASLVLSLFGTGIAYNLSHKEAPKATISSEDKAQLVKDVTDSVVAKLPVSTPATNVSNVPVIAKDRVIVREDKAVEFAKAEVETRSFKRDLADAVNAALSHTGSNSELKSYRDILSIDITDNDVTVNNRDGTVELEIVVKYLLDNDKDVADAERAKFNVKLNVDNLDERHDFKDAEVTSTDFKFVKFYEK